MPKPIKIVQGAQFGSEAKGMVALAVARKDGVNWAVRTGSVNAGHTVVVGDKRIAFQQLPVSCVDRDVNIVIGPGAYICPHTLRHELEVSGLKAGRLFIDHNCGVHLPSYTTEAKEAARNVKIGATGKGCAEAIIHKIKDRGVGKPLLFRDYMCEFGFGNLRSRLTDTAKLLTSAYDVGDSILIEGTQGELLDFHCGPYPFVTSRQTISASWVAECGLSPALNYDIILVARTFPIRVAGPSGPMPDEISWAALAREMNSRMESLGKSPIILDKYLVEFECHREVCLRDLLDQERPQEEIDLTLNTHALKSVSGECLAALSKLFETTTVTKRLRRISRLSVDQLRDTVYKVRPKYVVLTFVNYVFPELATEHNPGRNLSTSALRYVEKLEKDIGAPIRYVTLGPASEDLVEVNAERFKAAALAENGTPVSVGSLPLTDEQEGE